MDLDLDGSDLLSRLQLHNDFFKKMTDLIPAQYYFERENKNGAEAGSSKFFHNSKEKAPKQELKDKSKKKTTNKRQRLDPGQQRSVTQIQEEMDQGHMTGKEGVASSSRVWREKSEDESESDAMGTGLEDLSDESDEEAESSEGSKPKPPRIKPVSVESISSSATIDELREKVRKRIEELRTKRRAKPTPEDVVPKKLARKEADKEKKKKLETFKAIKAAKAQQEVLDKAKENVVEKGKVKEADKAKVKVADKAKEKVDTAKVKEVDEANEKELVNGDIDIDEDDNVSESDSDHEVRTKERTKKEKKSQKKKKMSDGRKGNGEVSFSRFDFSENEREQKPKRKRKKLLEPRSNKDFGRLLKKAELKEQKMAELKKKDPDKAQEVETEGKWQKVIDQAQGVKVKDDVELLKKSLKRKEQRKKSSKKQWEGRKARLEEKMKDKETKRRKNIKAKTDSRKAKQVKRLQHKGKLLSQD